MRRTEFSIPVEKRFHVHFSICIRNARRHLCIRRNMKCLPERQGAVSAIAPHGHGGMAKASRPVDAIDIHQTTLDRRIQAPPVLFRYSHGFLFGDKILTRMFGLPSLISFRLTPPYLIKFTLQIIKKRQQDPRIIAFPLLPHNPMPPSLSLASSWLLQVLVLVR